MELSGLGRGRMRVGGPSRGDGSGRGCLALKPLSPQSRRVLRGPEEASVACAQQAAPSLRAPRECCRKSQDLEEAAALKPQLGAHENLVDGRCP
jgi:hypothetical protein